MHMMKNLIWCLCFTFSFYALRAEAGNPQAGQGKFQQLCVTCHGASGKGDGPAAAALNPKPRDLSKTTKTDTELKMVISKGGPAAQLSPSMPAWGTMLSDVEIDNVISYIRSLK